MGEEDDEVDREGNDKEANKTSGSSAMDDLVVQDTFEADMDGSKENISCPNLILLDYSVEHAELGEQAIMGGTINSPAESKTAEPKALDISNLSHGLESLVEDSGGVFLAEEQKIDMLSRQRNKEAQFEEAQELMDTGLEELQKEVERNLNPTSGPIVIGSKDKLRASQVDGINLQVDLNPRKFGKALRNLTFEACSNSKECEEIHNTLTSVLHSQEGSMVLKELHNTKETGNKLGIDFGITDEMIMRKMIEIETKEYALLQRNNAS